MINKIRTKLFKTSPYREILILTIPLSIFFAVLSLSITLEGDQQFSELAKAFLHGHLNFLSPIGGLGQDPVLYHGKVYWDEGLFPAILLMPFVGFFSLFHQFFYQGYLMWLLIIGVFYFVIKLARLLSFSKVDSIILGLGFSLGSVFIGVSVVSSAWLFAQVVTTFLLFWGLYEYFTHKRWYLIGTICGLILMTRPSAAPIFIFFGLELWQTLGTKTQKIINILKLCLPIVIAASLVGIYNFLRFHNPLNSGYTYQLMNRDSVESRSYGIFGLIHLPSNLYSLILRAPIPILRNKSSWTLKFPFVEYNPLGMSIFITSPYLLHIFTNKWSSFELQTRHLIVALLASCVLVLTFWAIGTQQFGYRYSLDFLPELFLLFMIMYRKNHKYLSTGMKVLLLGSGIVNLYLMWLYI